MYVVSIDAEKNLVVLGDHHEVFSKEMIVERLNFISIPALIEPIRAKVKIRYTASEVPATLYPLENNKIKVSLMNPKEQLPWTSCCFL